MRSKRIPAEEQYRLIMECRQSGLTDHQWCVEHEPLFLFRYHILIHINCINILYIRLLNRIEEVVTCK